MAVSVKKLAIRGAVWTILGYGIANVIRLANNLVLTRLLVPEIFGLMGLVYTLRMGIELFSDYGISQSIINNKRGEEASFLNTAWTLQIIRGGQVWGASLLLTYPVATFYGEPRLYMLIPLVCFGAIFDGFASPATHLLHRRLDLGRLTIYELGFQIVSLSILIFLCWLSPTVWSIAIAGLCGTGLHMIASHYLIPGLSVKFGWDESVLKELRSFGRWIAVASIFLFVADQSDRMILGKLLSLQQFGVYIIAYTLASLPREVIRQLSGRVIFPAVSTQADLPRADLRAKILKPRWLVLIGAAWLLAIMTCFGDWIVMALYASRNQNWEQYQAAAWMMPILSVGIWFAVLFHSMSPVLLAIGKPMYSAQCNFARFVALAVGIPIAFNFYQTLGAIVVVAFSDIPLYLVNLFALGKEKLSSAMQDFQATLYFLGLLVGMLSLRYGLGYGLPLQLLWQS